MGQEIILVAAALAAVAIMALAWPAGPVLVICGTVLALFGAAQWPGIMSVMLIAVGLLWLGLGAVAQTVERAIIRPRPALPRFEEDEPLPPQRPRPQPDRQ